MSLRNRNYKNERFGVMEAPPRQRNTLLMGFGFGLGFVVSETQSPFACRVGDGSGCSVVSIPTPRVLL